MFKIPEKVIYILSILEKSGYEAFIVGGCVRDLLLSRTPHDWDITTNAEPDQIIDCFSHMPFVLTGIKHGTVTVNLQYELFEITTYRSDGEYLDNRHPSSVTFVKDLKSDLSRRDFTINAMAYSPKTGLIDYFSGFNDLKSKTICCVGNANKRFQEDALRIMRALRFSAELYFRIDIETAYALIQNKLLLKNIAVERVTSEFNKLLVSDNADYILRQYSAIFEVFIPEITPMLNFDQLNKYHYLTVWDHTLLALKNTPNSLILRLTLLLHDIAKPICFQEGVENGVLTRHFHGHPAESELMAIDILRRLKYDLSTIKSVSTLIKYHDAPIAVTKKSVRKYLNILGYELFDLLLLVKRADALAHTQAYIAFRLEELSRIKVLLKEVREQQLCFSLKNLAVNGKDLINIGIVEGKEIGKVLNTLLQLVIDEQLPNDKEVLLTHVRRELT